MSLPEAYAAKIARRPRETALLAEPDAEVRDFIIGDFLSAAYGATPEGEFKNVDRIMLRWLAPDYFEYLPDPDAPFSFKRHSGDVIVPGKMATDGGSIPRPLWFRKNLSPWCYVPAFLVHDWEFDQHHAGASAKDFDAVRDTLAEGLKTLMEANVCPKSEVTFRAIYAGVSSWAAKRIWAGV